MVLPAPLLPSKATNSPGAINAWGGRRPVFGTNPIAAAFPRIEGGRSGGDGYTPMARGLNQRRGFGVTHGASYLMVADVGGWDNSRFLLLPGQSIDPRSPHYKDFYDRWIAGAMIRSNFMWATV